MILNVFICISYEEKIFFPLKSNDKKKCYRILTRKIYDEILTFIKILQMVRITDFFPER